MRLTLRFSFALSLGATLMACSGTSFQSQSGLSFTGETSRGERSKDPSEEKGKP